MEQSNNNTTTLQETVVEKDLGTWMKNALKPHNYVVHAVSGPNQILGLIKRTFTYLDCQLVKQLFTSLVRPHLEYGNVVWSPYHRRDIDMLERVQHRSTRLVPGFSKLPYEERLKRMNLTTLKQRRQRGDMIEVYKYMNKKYDVDDSEVLPRHTAVGMETKGHSMKLKKRNCKGQRRASFFGLRVVNSWNQLPEKVIASTSVNCFKGRYDSFVCQLPEEGNLLSAKETIDPRA